MKDHKLLYGSSTHQYIPDAGKDMKRQGIMAELIKLYDEYLAFINEENKGAVTMAHVHGWRCEQEVIEKGVEYRKKIDELKKILGIIDS